MSRAGFAKFRASFGRALAALGLGAALALVPGAGAQAGVATQLCELRGVSAAAATDGQHVDPDAVVTEALRGWSREELEAGIAELRSEPDSPAVRADRELLIAEALAEGRAGQPAQAEAFFKNERQERNPVLRPRNFPGPEGNAYRSVVAALENRPEMFRLYQQLELEVYEYRLHSGRPSMDALDEVLSQWEARNGFNPVIDVRGPSPLPADKFDAMVASRTPWRDHWFTSDVYRNDLSYRASHSSQAHRIQWNLLMRFFGEHPEQIAGMKDVAHVFGMFGDHALMDRLADLNPSLRDDQKAFYPGVKNPPWDFWDRVLDTAKWCFGSPEFVRALHSYTPLIGLWQ